MWCLCSEIFPTAQRAKGVSITTTTNWTFGIVISLFVPVLQVREAKPARQPSPLQRRECRAQDALGFGLFLIFAGFCVVMAGFTAAFVPETRGVSIDAITQLWSVPSGKGNTLQQPLRS